MAPVRAALGQGTTLFVSDFRNGVIYQMAFPGSRVKVAQTIPVPGGPLGIAWAKNTLFVGLAEAGRVDAYRSPGQARYTVAARRWLFSLGGSGTFTEPTDIAVDTLQSLIFVLDAQQRAVKVFDLADGTPRFTISGPGLGAEQLQNPTALAVDPVGQEIVVSDYGEPTEPSTQPALKVFDYQGVLLTTISGKQGMMGQRFSRPQGLAVDGAGRIFMADALSGEVMVFDRQSGSLLTTFGTFGSGPGELWLPLDVVVNENQDLFVTNNRPGRIEVYETGGQIP